MKKVFKVKEKCQPCKGTGLYVGLGERDGFAVVCHNCKGTGCHEFVHHYEEFESRERRKNVGTVLETNPGICVGDQYDFGGMSHRDWKSGKEFPKGSEMRNYTCPSWWYQCANYDLKPKWDECSACGTFSSCKHFGKKEKCWKKFDKSTV